MSAIDQYKHRLLGFIECPSSFDIVYNNSTRKIAIYELLENIPVEEDDFDGKIGDILLGGGSGEAAAFRISIPQSILFFTRDDWYDFENYDELFKTFWTPTESYVFGEGFSKLGWNPNTAIEFWLAEVMCSVLIEKYDQFEIHKPTNWHSTIDLAFFEKFFKSDY